MSGTTSFYNPGRFAIISTPNGSEVISPIRDVNNNSDRELPLATLKSWIVSGLPGGLTVPNSSLLGGNGTNLIGLSIGSGLLLSGGTLTATAVVPTVPTASLVGGNGSIFTSVTVGAGLAFSSGTLSGLTAPNASLVGGNGTTLSGVAVGSGLNISGGTLTATAIVPTIPNANLVGGNGTTLTSISVGSGLTLSSGVLTGLTAPTGSLISGNGTTLSGVSVGSGLLLSGGTLTATAVVPAIPTASLIGGNGSTFTSITLGSGIGLSGGVLTATGTPTTIPNAPLVGGNGSTLTSITLGAGLTLTSGTLVATAGGGSTITSVNASGGTTGLTFSGGPITTGAGVLTVAGILQPLAGGTGFATTAANTIFAGPVSGGVGAPSARVLVSADLPANPVVPGTGAITFPTGTTAQEPSGVNGMARFNSTTSRFEYYIGAAWVNDVRLTGETGTIDFTTAQSVSIPAPSTNAHAATKLYVDTAAPIATSTLAGKVKPGPDFNVAGDGTLSIANAVTASPGGFAEWNASGVLVAKTLNRTVATTTVTPTTDDNEVLIFCNNASAQTVVANDIGVGNSYTIQQIGAGAVTVTAGAGVTLVSPNTTPSYKPAARYGSLVVTVVATNTVCVQGVML